MLKETGILRSRTFDNLIKSILDGMNTVVFADDSLISEITASKMWAAAGRAEIEIYAQTNEPRRI